MFISYLKLFLLLICLFGFYLNLIGSSAILSIISIVACKSIRLSLLTFSEAKLVYAYLGLQGSTFFVPNRIMCIKYALAAVILRLSHTAIQNLVTVCIKLLFEASVVIAYQNQEDHGLSSSPRKKYEK